MKVKDVLGKITCEDPETPIWVYNSAHKQHADFEYHEIADGNIPPAYMEEEVETYKQFGEQGPVSIILK